MDVNGVKFKLKLKKNKNSLLSAGNAFEIKKKTTNTNTEKIIYFLIIYFSRRIENRFGFVGKELLLGRSADRVN